MTTQQEAAVYDRVGFGTRAVVGEMQVWVSLAAGPARSKGRAARGLLWARAELEIPAHGRTHTGTGTERTVRLLPFRAWVLPAKLERFRCCSPRSLPLFQIFYFSSGKFFGNLSGWVGGLGICPAVTSVITA